MGGRGEGQGPRRLRASWEKGTWLRSTCLFQLRGSRGPGADFRRFPVQVLRAGSCRGGEEGGVWACTWGARVQGGGGGCLLPSASLCLPLSGTGLEVPPAGQGPGEGLTCKANIRNPGAGPAREASDSRRKANRVKGPFFFFSPPTYFTIKATFNPIEIYFPLWGLTALIFF